MWTTWNMHWSLSKHWGADKTKTQKLKAWSIQVSIWVVSGQLNEEIMVLKKTPQVTEIGCLPQECSGKSVCGTFLHISLIPLSIILWDMPEAAPFLSVFTFLSTAFLSFTFRPALICSLSLPASLFSHTFSKQGRSGTPRCLLNWKPALAAAASPSPRNTDRK